MFTKAALITGASSGIGKSIALELSKQEYFTFVHYNKNEEKALKTLNQIRESGGDGALVSFDVSDYESVKVNLHKLIKDHPDLKITALVNNAGITKDGFFALMSYEDYNSVIQTNLLGAMNVTHCLIRHMMGSKKPCSIVNISSLAGQTGNLGQTNYSASKAGMIAFTKSLCAEVGSKKIRVNCVAPGLIETEMTEEVPMIEAMIKKTPLKRMGDPLEVAKTVSFLCSEGANFITGATISVNGGLYPS